MNILLTLHKAVSLWPEREAVVDGDVRLTYRQLGGRIAQLIQVFVQLGLKPKQVVAILCPNVHEYLEAYYACASIGIILAPINFRLSFREIATILNDAEAVLLIAHTDFIRQVDHVVKFCPQIQNIIWVGLDPHPPLKVSCHRYEQVLSKTKVEPIALPVITDQDIAHLYYTSGTTGLPKGVMLTHGNVCWHALAAIAELHLNDHDTWLHAAPMFHLADAWATFAITWVGGKHIFLPYFNPDNALEVIEKKQVTITNLIPTMLNLMLNSLQLTAHDYSSLRMILSGGAPIAPAIVRQILNIFNCDYVQTYGMTETSPYISLSKLKVHHQDLSHDEQIKIKSKTGRPFIVVELKIIRSDGTVVAHNDVEVGEIIVRGPTVTPGYWKQPGITAETIRGGWLYTGDLATIDQEGYVNIVDRKKDMIISGGENIFSTEVEHVLYEHPSVLECAVIGIPDPIWGETVMAIVVLKLGLVIDEQTLIEFCRIKLAHYKCPKSINFVEKLPRTGSGKIYKQALKKQFAPQ